MMSIVVIRLVPYTFFENTPAIASGLIADASTSAHARLAGWNQMG